MAFELEIELAIMNLVDRVGDLAESEAQGRFKAELIGGVVDSPSSPIHRARVEAEICRIK